MDGDGETDGPVDNANDDIIQATAHCKTSLISII
jgi:hypothetical protein